MQQMGQTGRTTKETAQSEGRRLRLGLRDLVLEASQALTRLDASRLEELALSCRALNRVPAGLKEQAEWAVEAREAAHDLAVLGRVLEGTRANLEVMARRRDLRVGRLEYGPQPGAVGTDPKVVSALGAGSHGNH